MSTVGASLGLFVQGFPALDRVVNGANHALLEAPFNLVEIPLLVFEVLNPLKITDDDATTVGNDIGQYKDVLVLQDLICRRRHRTIGSFNNELRFDVVRIVSSNLALKCGGNEDVAIIS